MRRARSPRKNDREIPPSHEICNWYRCGEAGTESVLDGMLLRQPHHYGGVLADGIKHHRALELRGYFPQDVNALRFQGLQVGQSTGGHGVKSGRNGDRCAVLYSAATTTFRFQDNIDHEKAYLDDDDCPSGTSRPIRRHSAERIRAHNRFLASDLLEGRGVGQRGGDLATEYIATQFALAAPNRRATTARTSRRSRCLALRRSPTLLSAPPRQGDR